MVTVRDIRMFLNCLIEVFWIKFFIRFSKFELFFIKSGTKYVFFWSTLLRFARRSGLETVKP